MPEGGKPQGSADPTALWRQWSETTSKAWSSALEASKDQYADSYNLYRSWLKSMGGTSELSKLNPVGIMNPKEVWKLWFDSTVRIWRTAAESGGDPMGLITLWLKLMEETQAKILSGEALPTNLFAFYKQWYDATSDTWARFVEDTIGSEKFLEMVKPFLESYTTFIKTFRNAEEEYLRNLQIPTRSDVARVAALVVSLEEKVDQIDDAFDDGYAQMATRQSITELDRRLDQMERQLTPLSNVAQKVGALDAMAQRLSQVESKLDSISSVTEKIATAEDITQRLGQVESKLDPLSSILDQVRSVEGLTQRLGQVESKLDTLSAALEKTSEVEHLTERMDQVESRLSAVLAVLEQLVAKASTGPDKPDNTVPRKAPRKKNQQQEVKNPEPRIGAE
jgi:tetrahydromethanopterin S-methyltransferase subunit G